MTNKDPCVRMCCSHCPGVLWGRTCEHELRNIWLDVQTGEQGQGTLRLVDLLLHLTQLLVHPLDKGAGKQTQSLG